jgi:hypothetical protein
MPIIVMLLTGPSHHIRFAWKWSGPVLHPGKGGCADPVNEDAILERGGGRPPGRNRERQLASDTGDGKT